MKLGTLRNGGNGMLVVVSRDLTRAVPSNAAPSLMHALNSWDTALPVLQSEYAAINSAAPPQDSFDIDPAALDAVMPRSFQFLDASAFLAHNHILADAWDFERRGENEPPLMYQGLSHQFYSATDPVPFQFEVDLIDFEAEFGVITDAVPMGISAEAAVAHIKLIIIINDWSLRSFGPNEMRGGFGFLHAKPPSALSAFAVTPDELGDAWSGGRVNAPLSVYRNGDLFGEPNGAAMHFGFGELIAHAAATRNLCAGTIIGSGTVSNYDAAKVGSACIAERRALDALGEKPLTPYLGFGERVTIDLRDAHGASIMGAIDQRIIAAAAARPRSS